MEQGLQKEVSTKFLKLESNIKYLFERGNLEYSETPATTKWIFEIEKNWYNSTQLLFFNAQGVRKWGLLCELQVTE